MDLYQTPLQGSRISRYLDSFRRRSVDRSAGAKVAVGGEDVRDAAEATRSHDAVGAADDATQRAVQNPIPTPAFWRASAFRLLGQHRSRLPQCLTYRNRLLVLAPRCQMHSVQAACPLQVFRLVHASMYCFILKVGE